MIWLLLLGCGTCHPSQLVEWQASRHASAFTNAIFVESYARQRGKWCRDCHQPSGHQQGVECESCHVREGRILNRQELAAEDFCARCHQFNFPGRTQVMQDTFGEWQRSGVTARCQDCHMPNGAHTFPGGHDVELLKKTVIAEIVPSVRGVVVRMRARGAGHLVPTGDPFRRLYVEICEDSSCDEPIARPSFGRSFAADGWRQIVDTRLGEVEREVPTAAGKIWWRLWFGYAAGSSAPSLSGDDWAVELVRGELVR